MSKLSAHLCAFLLPFLASISSLQSNVLRVVVATAASVIQLMHSRSSKRKPRYQSEPPPSRPSLDSPSGSDDEMDVDDNHNLPEREGTSDSKERVLNVQQTNKNASIAEKARAALDSSLRTVINSGGKSRPIAFPLTPTSAAGESTDRTMASLTAAAAAAAAATVSAASENAVDNKKRKKGDERSNNSPEDKMSQPTTINDPSVRPPPPPEAPVNKNKNKNSTSIHLNSLRTSSSHSHPYAHANGSSASPVSAAPRTMSYRVENQSIRPRHFQEQNIHDSHYYGHPSPPPIATLTHSPSLSSDRSSVSSPAPTILPPLNHPNQFQPQPYITTSAHRYSASAQPGAYHHSHYYPGTVSPPEVFSTPTQSYAHAYGGGGYAPPPPPHIPFHHSADMSQYSVNPYATTSGLYGHAGHGGGGSGGFTPIYTDDASTKLSDRVRRRCFNCCTTETSTWRRSSLNPGKVLCNKCGLFERTHSRPRPDQFPHKRAPLQIPTQNIAHDAVNAAQSMSRSPHSQTPNAGQSLPPTTGHPSLGPTYSHPTPLPQIHEWNRANSNAALGAPNHSGTGSSTTSSSAGPSSRAHSSSSAAENRHHPYASSVPTSGAGAGTNSSSGAGETRSPQPVPSRLVKRSDSVNSDLVNTPPPQHRSSQNITPSPSPPPEVPQTGVTTSAQESSPRVLSQSVTTGTSSESGNQ